MDIAFLNGSSRQEAVVREALDLLRLDLDRFPFSIQFSFDPNPSSDPRIHHPFAVTNPVSGGAVIHIRDDFPRFAGGPEYETLPFARETVIHELGHALLHALPDAVQESIAAMFGTTTSTWEPLDAKWEDRPEEGIAETFKDAFLGQSDREFSNRTNFSIPLSKYAAFRALFRQQMDSFAATIDHFDVNDLASDYFQRHPNSLYPLWVYDAGNARLKSDVPDPTRQIVDVYSRRRMGDGTRGFRTNNPDSQFYGAELLVKDNWDFSGSDPIPPVIEWGEIPGETWYGTIELNVTVTEGSSLLWFLVYTNDSIFHADFAQEIDSDYFDIGAYPNFTDSYWVLARVDGNDLWGGLFLGEEEPFDRAPFVEVSGTIDPAHRAGIGADTIGYVAAHRHLGYGGEPTVWIDDFITSDVVNIPGEDVSPGEAAARAGSGGTRPKLRAVSGGRA